jgi:hypothetical protein
MTGMWSSTFVLLIIEFVTDLAVTEDDKRAIDLFFATSACLSFLGFVFYIVLMKTGQARGILISSINDQKIRRGRAVSIGLSSARRVVSDRFESFL